MSLSDWLHKPWPWWIAGPLIGLIVPALLILGNKPFGVSSSLRHICAACFPADIPFFKYNWKRESWNLFFVAGIVFGAMIHSAWLDDGREILVNPVLKEQLAEQGITNLRHPLPAEVFNWQNIMSLQGFFMIIAGGFLVGFGTRYAGGCTSGHSIMGLANLQWPSLVATVCFMIGGVLVANLVVPALLKL